MTAVKPIYPNGVFAWVDRVDQQSIDFAGDINSVASEIISIESTLGTTPNIERSNPVGLPITYPTVSARISDAMTSAQMPTVELSRTTLTIPNLNTGIINPYVASFDPFGMFNGVDITIPANGWWIVSASQSWSGWTDGYSHHYMTLNGSSNVVDQNVLNWEFPGNSISNGIPGRWQASSNAVIIGPPIIKPVVRPIVTTLFFQGLAHKGDRFSAFSENGTSNAAHIVNTLTLKASMVKKVSGTFTSG